ncbi:MAG: nicotinamide riboside transporter PnuC [Gammaproteobacteria bacterium]|nr:nicotinamide riboside transporter PnuC [Gammaproteobacteria bacterium]
MELQSLNWFEVSGLVSGLLAVWLLIRQNMWTWPVGLAYAVVSCAVFAEARLYADLILHIFYVGMNGYGWWYWLFAGARKRSSALPVSKVRARQAWALSVFSVIGILVMGTMLDRCTQADFAYWDSATTVLSFCAMWMMARKYVENWIVWFVVDIAAVALYLVKGLDLYALLYGVYLVMAVAGWMAWNRSLQALQSG